MSKAIITVVGKDTVGIIAKVCTYLAENQINILDISQTIVQGFFNMMMIVDQQYGKALRRDRGRFGGSGRGHRGKGEDPEGRNFYKNAPHIGGRYDQHIRGK